MLWAAGRGWGRSRRRFLIWWMRPERSWRSGATRRRTKPRGTGGASVPRGGGSRRARPLPRRRRTHRRSGGVFCRGPTRHPLPSNYGSLRLRLWLTRVDQESRRLPIFELEIFPLAVLLPGEAGDPVGDGRLQRLRL